MDTTPTHGYEVFAHRNGNFMYRIALVFLDHDMATSLAARLDASPSPYRHRVRKVTIVSTPHTGVSL